MLKRFLGVALSVILTFPAIGQEATLSEEPAAVAEQAAEGPPPPPSKLTIDIIAGEGAVNDIVSGEATAPRVMVRNEQGNPVAGAVVEFRTPIEGPSATFGSWIRTHTVRTDESGIANATQYAANGEVGDFVIQITARGENSLGTAAIEQSNAEISKRERSNKFKVLAMTVGIVVGGVIAGVAASDR